MEDALNTASRLCHWKKQIERCALPLFARNAHLSADMAHKGNHLRNAEAGPFFTFGCEEWLENTIKHFAGHA